MLNAVHQIAIICSNYEASKKFYTDVLGLNASYESVFPSAIAFLSFLHKSGLLNFSKVFKHLE